MSRGDAILVRVHFALEPQDGWPPVPDEALWAQAIGGGRYLIESPPWYVRGVAVDDEVSARADDDGRLWADGEVAPGGRLTVRVLPLPEGPLGGDPAAVAEAFGPLGVRCGDPSRHGIVALDIPGDGDLPAIKALLLDGESAGRWDFDEARTSPEWQAL